jgi:hypothetical protein
MTTDIPAAESKAQRRVRLAPVSGYLALGLVAIPLDEANTFVSNLHRYHEPCVGHKFSIAVHDGEKIRGVVIVGRPVSRMADDGVTLEVTRCCTDGAKNACSMLYGAARRACFALGYKRLITYTLPEEGGTSLRAAGWRLLGEAGGGKWGRKDRPRVDTHPTQTKLKWEAPDNASNSPTPSQQPEATKGK